jgi:Ca-activated chloride channel family protein
MGRHASSSTTDSRRGWRPPPVVLVAVLAVVVLVAGGLVWWLAGSDAASGDCPEPQTVRVTVAPEMAAVAEDLLGRELAGGCATAEVTAEQPVVTTAALTGGVESGIPDVWVPDSSLWPTQIDGSDVETVGSMASSPVVVATSRSSAEALGLGADAPPWLSLVSQALQSGRSIPVIDITSNVRQIAALLATDLTAGEDGQLSEEEVAATLQATQAAAPFAEVRDAVVRGDAEAGLLFVTEQDVLATHLAGDSEAVAVYPGGGSPVLDYPVIRTGDPGEARRDAVDAVVTALTSDTAADAVRAAGFRDAEGNPPEGVGPGTGTREDAPERVEMDPDAVRSAIAQANQALTPSRLLAVIDTSRSMEAPAAGGTLIDLAVSASQTALAGLPDDSSVGLWTFAYQVAGDKDYTERVPLRALDADANGVSQRDELNSALETLPSSLTPGGTGLYDTALAAVRAAREQYQDGAVSSVVLLTDGTNDDDAGGISLQGLIDTLRSEADPVRPVPLIGVALGPESDLTALQQMSEATGGRTYSAQDPGDLREVLFEAIRNR